VARDIRFRKRYNTQIIKYLHAGAEKIGRLPPIRTVLGPPVAHLLGGREVKITMNHRKRGFTVTELMISIVIFGLLAAVSIPAFGKFMQSWRLNGEIDQLAGLMARARSAAVTKNTTTVFKFQMSEGTYYYFEDENDDGRRNSSEYQSAIRELPPGVQFASHTLSGPILIFGSRGNAQESGTVTLRNNRQNTKTVTIFGGTGNITSD
jgi:prepilin-type N-terminal cleavage/methylation domain-containing protein